MLSEDYFSKQISVSVPLTEQSGKVRIKVREAMNQYGRPTATRQEPFSENHYVEWQIGYDVVKSEKEKFELTTLVRLLFEGANGKIKAPYELGEFLYYFAKMGVIGTAELNDLRRFLTNLRSGDFISEKFQILRSKESTVSLAGMDFSQGEIRYPILIHKIPKTEFEVEIVLRERQRAIGVQPMLYVCFPVARLTTGFLPLLGRCALKKETANLILNSSDGVFVLELLKIFGLLSEALRHDVLEILKLVHSEC